MLTCVQASTMSAESLLVTKPSLPRKAMSVAYMLQTGLQNILKTKNHDEFLDNIDMSKV